MYTTKMQLKEKVKMFALDSAKARKDIRESSGTVRACNWTKKRDIGQSARYALLAYAFVCNKPYRVLEKKCLEDVSPYQRDILIREVHKVVLAADPPFTVLKEGLRIWMDIPGVSVSVEEAPVEASKEEAAE